MLALAWRAVDLVGQEVDLQLLTYLLLTALSAHSVHSPHPPVQRVVVDTERPWTAASSTYYMPPGEQSVNGLAVPRLLCHRCSQACVVQRRAQAPSCKLQSCPSTCPATPSASSLPHTAAEVEAEARRRQQREASEVNRLQAQRRAAVEAAQRAAEQDALRRTMAAEVGAG